MEPAFLTLPAAGANPLGQVHRKVVLLAVRALFTIEPATHQASWRALLAVLRRVLADAPKRLLAAVDHPEVLPWLLLAKQGWSPDEVVQAVAPTLLLRLGSLPEAVLWAHPVPAPTDGARVWPAIEGLTADPEGIRVRIDGVDHAPGDVTTEAIAHTLRPGVHLALHDRFPLSHHEAHPDKQGNALDLGGQPLEAWVHSLQVALGLVEQGLPHWAHELGTSLQRLIPVGYQPQMHLSASYREAPNQAYLTLHPDRLTLAEAIVHETQHGKLNRLLWLDRVLINGRDCWTSSPVRPDLRPLEGVLLAAHAFVPVAALHAALADHDWPDPHRFARRRAEVLAGNTRALDLLADLAEPTPLGKRLLDDLHRVHAALLDAAPDLPQVEPDRMPPG